MLTMETASLCAKLMEARQDVGKYVWFSWYWVLFWDSDLCSAHSGALWKMKFVFRVCFECFHVSVATGCISGQKCSV